MIICGGFSVNDRNSKLGLMLRRKLAFQHIPTRQRLCYAVAAGVLLAALPVTLEPFPQVPSAYAQESDAANKALFLAVDRDDLPGVRTALNNKIGRAKVRTSVTSGTRDPSSS